jgi:hypothetical protein
VFLTESDIEFFHPLAIAVAELAVLIAFRVCLSVLVPQQLEGNSFSLQLFVKIVHGRHRALAGSERGFVREKHVFKSRMIQGRVKRPG